jgi:hypothetical protein
MEPPAGICVLPYAKYLGASHRGDGPVQPYHYKHGNARRLFFFDGPIYNVRPMPSCIHHTGIHHVYTCQASHVSSCYFPRSLSLATFMEAHVIPPVPLGNGPVVPLHEYTAEFAATANPFVPISNGPVVELTLTTQ